MPVETATGYTSRVLPAPEWERLIGLTFAEHGLPDPDLTTVVVVEQGDRIVGVWVAMTAVHLEGLWVDPAHQGTTVAGRLLRQMREFLQTHGITISFTIIADPQVMVLAHKAGFTRYPGDLWVLQLPPQEMVT